MFFGFLRSDIEEIYSSCRYFWPSLEYSNILVMGGTGFVGKWLVASLGYAQLSGTNLKLTVLSRQPSTHSDAYAVEGVKISWIKHDVSKDSDLDVRKFTHIINAATPSSASTGAVQPSYVYNSIVKGNNLILNSLHNTDFRYVFLSSGAVSHLETTELKFDRDICEAKHLDTLPLAYSHGKRFAEMDIEKAVSEEGLNAQSLRLYAFAGPGLPLDQHFAAGNFMRDFLDSKSIEIKGNPETQRSYMYPTDLAVHILKSLTLRVTKTQEVGSSEVVSMLELAKRICGGVNKLSVSKSKFKQPLSMYFPKEEGLLGQTINLDESINRWKNWLLFSRN